MEQPQQNHNNFWSGLKKPFFVLAPMADVTDPAFRRIVAKYGKPDVLWTEFVSADGLAHKAAREKLVRDLAYTEAERPIIAQLFSSNPENMRAACKLCAELDFDGIDINMGCPDKSIEKQGAGAAMIRTPDIAVAVITAAKAGIRDAGKNIPLSVKTRIGYSKNEIETWLPLLLAQDLAAITVHCRTRKEMSKVPANWGMVRRAVELRDTASVSTLIIGNGDVQDMTDGLAKAKEAGCDGIMIGRAVFGNPWLFANFADAQHPSKIEHPVSFLLKLKKQFAKIFRIQVISSAQSRNWPNSPKDEECAAFSSSRKNGTGIANLYHQFLQLFGVKNRYWLRNHSGISKEQKLRVMMEHSKLFEELLGDIKSFSIMKKHFKAYVNGFSGAKELRQKLFDEGNTAGDVERIVEHYLSTFAQDKNTVQ